MIIILSHRRRSGDSHPELAWGLCGLARCLVPIGSLSAHESILILILREGRVTETDELLTPQGRVAARCPQFCGHSQPFLQLLLLPPTPPFLLLSPPGEPFFPSMFLS